jgi:hypothetical protein
MNPNNSIIISFNTLRKMIGILGMALPFICVLGSSLLSHCWCLETSISFYYFTELGGVVTGTLCSLGTFLLSYNGYELKDTIASKLGGIFAILIALFPAKGPAEWSACDIIQRYNSPFSDTVHSAATVLFFAVLIYMSLFLFTKGDSNPTPQKLKRNTVYRICGYTMLVSIVILGIFYLFAKDFPPSWSNFHPILVFETIALLAFGVSWLTKGEAILKDK